jgi:hypothetical protein
MEKGVGRAVGKPTIPVDLVMEALRMNRGKDPQAEKSTTLPQPDHSGIHN